jgi:large subunit ribosomal protein L35
MPHLKTKKGVAKRFKLTKKGKFKYFTGGKSHLSTSKKQKRLRKMRKSRVIVGSNVIKYLKRMMPYG